MTYLFFLFQPKHFFVDVNLEISPSVRLRFAFLKDLFEQFGYRVLESSAACGDAKRKI